MKVIKPYTPYQQSKQRPELVYWDAERFITDNTAVLDNQSLVELESVAWE